MFRPISRRFSAGLLLLSAVSAFADAAAKTDSLSNPTRVALSDSARTDSARAHVSAPRFRWPAAPDTRACAEPLETAEDCWRSSRRWAVQGTGFPGIRSKGLSLSSLEPLRVRTFFQPAAEFSPYGTGGLAPFETLRENDGVEEVWTPVSPLDTPVTELHWMKGALFLNQFDLKLQRMVGARAYLGLDYHTDNAEKTFYEYSFNVHQPYLSGLGLGQFLPGLKRDSLSLVIQDTSHSIGAVEIRPRLGFWIGQHTVIETYGDWQTNRTSMANPTNTNLLAQSARDSLQLLYPSSFSAVAFGAVAAHATESQVLRATVSHSTWTRSLDPQGATAVPEDASGALDRFETEWTVLELPGSPRLRLDAENSEQDNALWTGNSRPETRSADGSAREDRETAILAAQPRWGFLELELNGEAGRRGRADGVQELLGGGSGDAVADLPWGFSAHGGGGWKREGAPDDNLFRWQPALGLYPNPDLKPRTDMHYGAGAEWESAHLGFGGGWERHIFKDSWLPRILPEPDVCGKADSTRYPTEFTSEFQSLCSDGTGMPDSLALALVNYRREARDLLHLSLFLGAGNWKLSLYHTYLLTDRVRDARLGFAETNLQLPKNVYKGQLLWRRKVLNQKLGLQTQWDWEWYSARTVYASDQDGLSRAVKLDEYLALDFTARMEIKTFLLYFRAMNLNHDRYATEPGVHPPGVNFRFGVDWKLLN